MNVHLVRSPELSTDTYRNVLQLLQQFRGPVNFVECEADALSGSDAVVRSWPDKGTFERKLKAEACHSQPPAKLYDAEPIHFPFEELFESWDSLFRRCRDFRVMHGIPGDDIVILLTDVGNESNWFGSVADSMRDIFIQTSNWHHYLGNSIDIRFPIAYEIAVWVLRHFMFGTRAEIMTGIHEIPKGCVNDFCQEKSQVMLKMRTADMCESCMARLIEKDMPALLCRQFFSIMDGIRSNMTFRERSPLLRHPSRIEVLLFLTHPNGFALTEIQDHTIELTQLYSRFCTQDEQSLITDAITRLVDPLDNDINVVLSRIRKKLKEAVGQSLLDYYAIDGERGGKKKIRLDRELISFT
jgi:hypothetical protein